VQPKFVGLNLGDTGDQAEMVVIAPAFVAAIAPAADIAVLFGFRVGGALVAFGKTGRKRTLHLPKIGSVIGKSELLWLEV
jgi:hypothetical protein